MPPMHIGTPFQNAWGDKKFAKSLNIQSFHHNKSMIWRKKHALSDRMNFEHRRPPLGVDEMAILWSNSPFTTYFWVFDRWSIVPQSGDSFRNW